MEIRISIGDRKLMVILSVMVALSMVGIAVGYNSNSPTTMGHSWDEMECGKFCVGSEGDVSVTGGSDSWWGLFGNSVGIMTANANTGEAYFGNNIFSQKSIRSCLGNDNGCGLIVSDDGGFFDYNDGWIRFIGLASGSQGLAIDSGYGNNLWVAGYLSVNGPLYAGTGNFAGNIGTAGKSANCPNGWGCGVHTWDVYADSSIRTHYLCLGGGQGTANTGDCRTAWPDITCNWGDAWFYTAASGCPCGCTPQTVLNMYCTGGKVTQAKKETICLTCYACGP